MGVPLCDGGEKKFNWASELSTIFPQKPTVVFGGGFLLGTIGFLARLIWFNRHPVPRGLTEEHSGKSLASFDLPWFKWTVPAEIGNPFC